MRVLLRAIASMVLVVPCVVMAQQARVPAEFTTIQEAIDFGATTVLVAPGTYPEHVFIDRPLQLLSDSADVASWPENMPVLDGLSISRYAYDVHVRGFHFLGVVERDPKDMAVTSFSRCRMDSGYAGARHGSIGSTTTISRCRVFGSIEVDAGFVGVDSNVITGGGVWAGTDGDGLIIGNVIEGPSAYGVHQAGERCTVRGNTIQNVVTGIEGGRTTVTGNVVQRCSEVGIHIWGPGRVLGNRVDSVGTFGIHTGPYGFTTVDSNTVTHSGGPGIWIEGSGQPSRNVVLGASDDGIRSSGAAIGNVVGRCHGAGIVAAGAMRNTCYLNDGDAFVYEGGDGDSVAGNIAYMNGGDALRLEGVGEPWIGCNDGFANGGSGFSSPTDVALDPLFCDVEHDDVGLREDSPLISLAECDLVGARGPSCSVTTAVAGGALEAHRQPRGVRIVWILSGTVEGPWLAIERSESEAGPWRSLTTLTNARTGEWIDRMAPAWGVLFYRLHAPSGVVAETRLEQDRSDFSLELLGPTVARGALEFALTVPSDSDVSLAVVDVQGRVVADLLHERVSAGVHRASWEGNAPSGIYFVRARVGGASRMRRVMLVK